MEALAAALKGELERRLAEPMPPGLYLVATPIGNLGDISVRALAALARADILCCEDTRHSRTLLAHYGISRSLAAYHEHNAAGERPRLLAAMTAGKSVALISDAGTPLISDPGYKLALEARDAGIAVTTLPGASAVMAALTVSGQPSDAFHFAGFLPPKSGARRTRLAALANIDATLVVFEAPGRLAATLADIEVSLGARPVSVARELTKRFEEVRTGTAAELLASLDEFGAKGEIVIVIGPPEAKGELADADIEAALSEALVGATLRDGTREVAERLGVSRARVYELALRMKQGRCE